MKDKSNLALFDSISPVVWRLPRMLACACQPGYPNERVPEALVSVWLKHVQAEGIASIVCLLSDDELERYYTREGVDLLRCYTEAGFKVERVPVPDREEPPVTDDELRQVHEVLRTLPPPWLVHCSAGVDRTGGVVEFLLRTQGLAAPAS